MCGSRFCIPRKKLLFPKQNYNVLSPSSFTYISVRDLYISRIGLPILLQEISGPILGIYKSLTNTLMRKSGLRPCNSQKRNTVHKWNFLCSALLLQGERIEIDFKLHNFSLNLCPWLYLIILPLTNHFHPLLLQEERLETFEERVS